MAKKYVYSRKKSGSYKRKSSRKRSVTKSKKGWGRPYGY